MKNTLIRGKEEVSNTAESGVKSVLGFETFI